MPDEVGSTALCDGELIAFELARRRLHAVVGRHDPERSCHNRLQTTARYLKVDVHDLKVACIGVVPRVAGAAMYNVGVGDPSWLS